jgi:hypothetical protein
MAGLATPMGRAADIQFLLTRKSLGVAAMERI